jgi:eukaryotic-like serine/threonine-protein kinase
MTPDRWQQVKSVFHRALELAPDQRSSFLDHFCTSDASLRQEVESLLASDQEACSGFLELGSSCATLREGTKLGAYEVQSLLNSGGMGVVYRAIRADGQYRQQVALKIVRADLGGELSLAKFRNERQILATLDHPNVAKILDGGTTEGGTPYFVMELIEGSPITQFCDQHNLSIQDRLKVFRTVCSAVQYAHQHLVVHRDLKPSNILVTANGTPKLLDFGIAKILRPNPAEQNVTAAGLLMMTPEYASPEQLRGEPITTATDVYSLGLILYELLTGCHPFRAHGNMPHEVARGVLEMEPKKPSAALRQKETQKLGEQGNSASPPAFGGAHGASVDKLSRLVSGDLDSIVLKTLRKEPHDRYNSADQLSEDIRRHLERLPVLARKGTLSYRGSKYLRRHKVGLASVALVFVMLLAGIAATVREARIAQRNEIRAEKRFNDVRKLANSLLFDIHDSVKDLPGSTPARKMIVQNALQYLDSLSSEAAGDDPSLQRELATAYERVAEVQGDYIFFNLGETENALRNYQKALSLRKTVTASKSATWQDQLALAKSYRLVAAQIRVTGDLPAAFQNAEEAISIGERLRAAHPQDKQVLAELRTAYERKGHIERGSWTQASPGDAPSALESFRRAMEIDAALLKLEPGNEDFQYAAGNDELYYAEVLPHTKDAEKLQHFLHVLDIDKMLNEHAPSVQHARGVAEDYNRIAMLYNAQRDHIKSAEYHRHYLEIIEPLYASDPKNTLLKEDVVIGSANLGAQIGFMGNKKESERLLDRAVTLMQSIAEAAPENTSHQGSLAAAIGMRGDNFLYWKNFKAGLDDYEAAIEIYRRLLAKNPNNTTARKRWLICRITAAHVKLQMGSVQADAELQSALADAKPMLQSDKADDGILYPAAFGYADLGKEEMTAARHAVTDTIGSHWQSAADWFRLSLSTLKQVQDLAGQAEDEAFGALDPAGISKQLAICQSALSRTPHSTVGAQ